jgi:hypothetical protein
MFNWKFIVLSTRHVITIFFTSVVCVCVSAAESRLILWDSSPVLRAAKSLNLTSTMDALKRQESDDAVEFLIWRLLCQKEEATGFTSLNPQEQDAYVYFQMLRIVGRDGFTKYLDGGSRQNAGLVLGALDRIGAIELKKIYEPFHRALFGSKPPPSDLKAVAKLVERLTSGKQSEKIESIAYKADDLVRELPESAQPRLDSLVRNAPESFRYPLAFYEDFFERGNLHLMFPEDRKFSMSGEGGRDDWRDATVTITRPGEKISIPTREITNLTVRSRTAIPGYSSFEFVLRTTSRGEITVPYFAKGNAHSETVFLYELGFDNDPVDAGLSSLITLKRMNSIKSFPQLDIPRRAPPRK